MLLRNGNNNIVQTKTQTYNYFTCYGTTGLDETVHCYPKYPGITESIEYFVNYISVTDLILLDVWKLGVGTCKQTSIKFSYQWLLLQSVHF